MQRKAIFVDVDGTLVTHDGRIPDSARDAIRAARANGHLVFVCSGRALPELWPSLLAIGFDGTVCGAGAYVAVGDEVLSVTTFDADLLRRIRTYLDAHDLDYFLEGPTGVWGTPRTRERALGLLTEHFPDADARAAVTDGFLCFIGGMEEASDDLTGISKIVFIAGPLADVDDARAEFGDAVDIVSSSVILFGQRSGEIQLPGVHKAAGIERIAAHLGVDLADTIALGDNDNDLEMLRLAGVGIAMGNAAPHVQAAADEVTAAVDADGLADAFRRHGLI